MKNIKSYGITKNVRIKDNFELHLEEFNFLGYTIIKNGLDKKDVEILSKDLDRIYKIQEAEFGKSKLKSINEENLVRFPLAYSEKFADLATHPKFLKYVEKILGNYFILHLQNGIINIPGTEHHQSSWHRDLPYQNWTSSEPLACNVFFCLDDFNENTGGTYVLPFSHQYTQTPSANFIENKSIQINAPAGSVIIFNSMLFHKAGFNYSNDTIRRGINQLYAKAFIAQQMNLPALLHGKYANDPVKKMIFGYQTQLATSVKEFRAMRYRKNKL